MTPILLFHFHTHLDLCRSRVEILSELNPELRIFGLYGGDGIATTEMNALRHAGLDSVYVDPVPATSFHRWKNTDLLVLDWYRHVGRDVHFDRVHVIQWDLLHFVAARDLYPDIPLNAIALSGLTFLEQVEQSWAWTTHHALAPESRQFIASVRQSFGYRLNPRICIGPGYSLSRSFLDAYSDLKPPHLGHDELRLPVFADILGFDLIDTGFYQGWSHPETELLFNADQNEIDPSRVERELGSPGGRRVFHPCRLRFGENVVRDLFGKMAV